MKPTHALRAFLIGSSLLTSATSLHAADYYWDDNAAGIGFGTAGASTGTWAGPTTGPTAGWSLSTTGANAFAGFTTNNTDSVNFGNGATGLAAGTITVSGAVTTRNMTFASGSGAIILSGGTSITMGGATPTITVNNAQNTISTPILQSASGNNTGLTKAGAGELILNGTGNSIAGDSGANGVGVRIAAGTLTVSGGSLAVPTTAKGLGTFSGDTGAFNQTGGAVTLAGDLIVGWNSGTTFTLSGGTLGAANIRHADSGDGVINISGTNTTTVGNVSHATAGAGTDSLTLNLNTGGTLAANSLNLSLSGSAVTTGNHSLNVNFNGGTLRARSTGNLIAATPTGTSTRAINAVVKTGGAIFDTNGFQATVNQALVHDSGGPAIDGGLTKSGAGTLVLSSAANTYTGATTINAGTLRVGNSGTSNVVTIANSGFESPTTATHTYTPSGAGWTFVSAGVTKTTFNATAPPEGLQAGFLQGDTGSITQTVTVGADGLYQINFQAQGRGAAFGPLGINVQVNGATVGTWAHTAVSQTEWLSYTTGIHLTAGTHTLAFLGNNTAGGDKSSSIDRVQMAQATGSLPTNTPVNLTTSGATLDLNFTTQTVRSLTGVSGTSVTNGDLIIGGSETATFAGVISGTGNRLSITGSGTQTLSGTNTYTGSTTVNGGKLTISSTGNINTTSGVSIGAGEFNYNSSTALSKPITFSSTGGTLSGSGTISQTVTISAGNTLSIGNSPGTMNFGDGLILAGTAIMEIDGTAGAGLTGGHDFANVTGGTLTYGGTMTLDIGMIFGEGTYTWNLFDFAGSDLGTFTSITLADQYFGSLTDLNTDGIWDLVSGDNTWQFTESTGVLGLTVIPEPGAALLGSLGLLALLRRRR